jgi:glucose-1-phosphate cytidylyltransferase|tara:strand:- start:256 stop:1038 length:783 start_codon:yes stop_codon:yes gene_type:complete
MKRNKRSVIILCGGKGTRLGDLGKKIPKTLVKIQGKEILWYIIKFLKKNKFNHLILPLGYKAELIKKFLKINKNFNIDIDCVMTGINANIGSRIALAQSKIESENILLLNGDAVFNFNINKIFTSHERNNTSVSFLSGETTYPYGTIGVKKGKITDFKRNLIYDSLSVRLLSNYVAYNYTGISIIKSKLIKNMIKIYKNTKNFEQTFFSKIIRSHESQLVKIKGFFHSIDSVKDIIVVDNKLNKDKKFIELKKLKKLCLK